MLRVNYRNYPFFVVEIFSDGTVDRKFVTRILFHYETFSPSKHFLIRIFRTGARKRGVNGQRCEVELKSAAVTKWKSRMSLRQYFKSLLPDPRGSLSESLPSAAIVAPCSRTSIRFFPRINWKYFRTVTPVRNLFHT